MVNSVGGKAGVKGNVAQGNGPDVANVEEGIKAATDYLAKFKL